MDKITPGNIVEDKNLLGLRDAFHVPSVLVSAEEPWNIQPGDQVRFTDIECTMVAKDESLDYHAIVDPFLGEIKYGDMFWVFLRPGIVKDVVHSFDIKLPETTDLEKELLQQRKDDPLCASCWQIEDGKIIRY